MKPSAIVVNPFRHPSPWSLSPGGRWPWRLVLLAALLAALLSGALYSGGVALAQGSAPGTPAQPNGTAVFIGGVDLEWNEVPGAESYDVQLYRNGQWIDLPGDGIEIAFYGAGAIISELNHEGSSYWFQVRAKNVHGSSDWSDFNWMAPTAFHDLGERARPDNVSASGAPVIDGTAQVGETLTASTTGIEDENGLDRVEFRFQWISNDGSADTDIAGATDSTYTLAAIDEGKTIKVRVAFTDRGGYAESLTGGETPSVAARPNSSATGAPAVTGTAQVGETLTSDTSGIADADGLTKVSYSYQWVANDGTSDTDITGATDSTYTLAAADEGRTVKVKVSFTDDAGNDESLTSAATGSVAPRPNRPATGAPTINGTAEVGEILTANTSGIVDADGLTKVSFSYQWISNDGSSDTDITGATDSTYTLVAADEGKAIEVRVAFTDDAGNDETLTSAATDEVSFAVQPQTANDPATGEPVITGTAQVGETLTADTSGISDADGLAGPAFAYQWLSDDAEIASANEGTYVLTSNEMDKTIKVRVSFTDDGGNEETLTSTATGAVSPAVQQQQASNTPATGTPTISVYSRGDYVGVGQELEVDTSDITDDDGLTGHWPQLQWIANDGSSDADIPGATFPIYTLEPHDEGKTIKVRVSFTDARGNAESLTSAATGPVGPDIGEPPLTLSGLSVSQGTLTPTFNSNTHSYTVPDVANAEIRITITPTFEEGYFVKFFEASETWSGLWVSVNFGNPSGLSDDCDRGDSGGDRGSFIELTDADPDTPGFQVDLYDGDNWVHVRVFPIEECDFGDGFHLGITRAVGPISLPRPNSPPVGWPYITVIRPGRTGPESVDRPLVGYSLNADVSQITDRNGMANATFGYQWLVDDVEIAGATGFSYPLTTGELGKTFKVRVSITDDDGFMKSLTSTATKTVGAFPTNGKQWDNSPATGAPIIYGTVQVGETLTADTSGIADEDGLDYVAFSYQWLVDRLPGLPGGGAHIAGANEDTYTLVADDVGKAIKVMVTFNDDRGSREHLYGPFTEVVSPAVQQQQSSNTLATGAPTISGTAQVGKALTADTWGIADADGLDYAAFHYQWMVNSGGSDAAIPDATGYTYTVVSDDVGKTIKVKVIFIDDAGNGETLTSSATAAVDAALNTPATGAPAISGTAQVGERLTADTSGIADADGLSGATYSYKWIANDGTSDADITGATASTYTLVAADEGKTIKVRVSFADDDGYAESLTSAATATVAAAPNSPATGAPAVTGTAQVGETLTAGASGIADADRLTNVSYRYQWIANDGTADTDITGATDSTYTLVSADEGQTIKVRVSFTDDAGNQEMLTSAPTAVVAASAQVDSENEPSELSHLTVVVTEDDSDPDDVVSTFTITWNDAEDCSASYNAYLDGVVGEPIHLGSAASEGEQIAGSLTNVSAETFGFNAKLHCGTIGSGRLVDRLWIPEYNRSFGTLPISRAYLPKPGTYSTEPGLIALTVSSGTLTPAFHNHTLNYTVPDVPNADGRFTLTTTAKADYYNVAFLPGSYYTFFSVCSHGGQETSLSYGDDAGNRIYPLTDADANTPGFQMDLDEGENVFYIRVWPNCENGQRYKLTVTRAANAPANTPATGAPTIGGTARVGQTLTADTTGIADSDGLENATFAYQWLADDTDISEAMGHTYTPVESDEGKTIKVEVSFTDDADNEETLASQATAEVAAGAPTDPPGKPRNLTGTANADGTVTLRWDAPNDDSVTGYQILRRRPSEGEKTLLVHVNDTGNTATEYTDNDVTPDVGHAYRVKAINAVGLSKWSKFVNVTPTQPAGPAQNNLATGAPTISGTAQVGETLTADTSGIADTDGLTNVSYSYQWIRNDGSSETDIEDATESSYTLAAADEGKTIKVEVSFTDDAGNGESLTSAATDAVSFAVQQQQANSPATGAPTIRGTAQVGETLAAHTSDIGDDDGLTNVTFSYQWVANDGSSDTDIQDATGPSYILGAADEGKTIKVEVSFTDDAGNGESLTSAATDAVAGLPNSPATGAPTIGGTARVGQTLTADTTGIADSDGLENATFAYQWQADSADISDATGSTYTPVVDDQGKSISVTVSFTDDAGNDETLTSVATDAVEAKPNTPAMGQPAITGMSLVGETLTAGTSGISDADGLTNAVFSYQWLADGADISGATASTYTPVDADEGKAVSVTVSFTDDAGNEEESTSGATDAVEARPNSPATGVPTITGTAQAGETLTADTSGIEDADGLADASYSYQWLAEDAEISGATDSTYTLASNDVGRTIKVRVSFTDDRGHGEELTSAATEAVAGLPPPPLTASLENTPSYHDGESVFTFELRFSEEFGLSYKTLRDHAFTVTGGTVKKAQRLEQGSNIGWGITVQPNTNGAVTITLPETRDCDNQGAICTGDGRKLSHRLELTVSGPGG